MDKGRGDPRGKAEEEGVIEAFDLAFTFCQPVQSWSTASEAIDFLHY